MCSYDEQSDRTSIKATFAAFQIFPFQPLYSALSRDFFLLNKNIL